MYQGQYLDVETGLYYNRFRYYDPSVGNYISKDPTALLGGSRLYGYVRNSNTWIDPFGLVAGRMNGATATISTDTDSVTMSSKNKVHAEMRGLDKLGKEGKLVGKDVVIRDVIGHYQGGVDAPAGMCVKCRTEMFEKLDRYGASSVTVSMTKSNQVLDTITIPSENFAAARKNLETIRNGKGNNKQKSDAAWEALQKHSSH